MYIIATLLRVGYHLLPVFAGRASHNSAQFIFVAAHQ